MTRFVPILIVIALFALLGELLILINSQYDQITVMEKQLEIAQESHVTGLINSYTSEVQACSQAAKEVQPENLNEFIIEKCLDPINETRVADLLRKWNLEDKILTEPAS